MNWLQKVYAAGPIPETLNDPFRQKFGDPTNNPPTLAKIFSFALDLLIGVGWALVFVCAAIAIVKYIMSEGDPKETGTASKWMLFIFFGTLIMIMITVLRRAAYSLVGVRNDWQINGVTNF